MYIFCVVAHFLWLFSSANSFHSIYSHITWQQNAGLSFMMLMLWMIEQTELLFTLLQFGKHHPILLAGYNSIRYNGVNGIDIYWSSETTICFPTGSIPAKWLIDLGTATRPFTWYSSYDTCIAELCHLCYTETATDQSVRLQQQWNVCLVTIRLPQNKSFTPVLTIFKPWYILLSTFSVDYYPPMGFYGSGDCRKNIGFLSRIYALTTLWLLHAFS